MDFYYTTATVKTVLNHPTTGVNQLFRKCRASREIFQEILRNPRTHSGIGYRRKEKAALCIPDIWPPDHEMASTATSDDEDDGSEDKAENTAPTIYYGKNPLYNFQKQGHENREVSLQALTSDFEFKQWQEASRQLWACIHAKFYVSIPQTRRRRAR
jgi:hypothetical protein